MRHPPRTPTVVLRELAGFFALAFGLTWACWLAPLLVHNVAVRNWLETAGQYGPLAAALLVTARSAGLSGLRRFLGSLVRWRFNPGLALLALCLPPLAMYASVALYANWSGQSPRFRPYDPLTDVLANFVLTVLWGGPLGEEPGWRGFALPRLQSVLRPVPATLALGLLWAAWHFPRWWAAGQFPPRIVVPYVVGTVAFGALFTLLYNRSGGSVLPCLLLHGSANTFYVLLPVVRVWDAWTVVLCLVATAAVLLDPDLGARPAAGGGPLRTGRSPLAAECPVAAPHSRR